MRLEPALIRSPKNASLCAIDLLTNDGMPRHLASDLIATAIKQGREPQEFAQHILEVRAAMRDE